MERFDYAEDDRIWGDFLLHANFVDLLTGKAKIVKLPWKPKEGETYWTFILYDSDIRLGIEPHEWLDDIFDFALFKAGWIYRSYEEAEAALPAVAKAMNIEYKILGGLL